jgi:hypothetical protein
MSNGYYSILLYLFDTLVVLEELIGRVLFDKRDPKLL